MSFDEPITVPLRAGRAVIARAPVAWLCHLVRVATLLYATIAVAVLALTPLRPEWLFAEQARGLGVDLAGLATWQILAALVPAGAGVVAAVLMMVALYKLFGQFAAGRVFGTESAHHLRVAATCAVAALVLEIVARPAVSLLLTLDRGPGRRIVELGLGSHDLSNLIFAGTMLALAHVLGQAGHIADDNSTIV